MRKVQSIANKIVSGQGLGRVAIKQDGRFYQANYAQEAQFGGDFTETERICRGLIVRNDGKIMALPMPKFFNLGEPQCPSLPDEPYTVWEKLDGSLGIFWHDGERWRCNTRGAFDNEYTRFALDYWVAHGCGGFFPEHWTVMCEICMDNDDSPRAAYHPEGLYLIAITDRHSGKDIDISSVETNLTKAQPVNATIDELIKRKQTDEGHEGWVARFDSGFRIKIKTVWYLRVFRAMKAMSPKRIRELMLDEDLDLVKQFPDDLQAEALEIQEQIERQFKDELYAVYEAYSKVAGIETRKEFALVVMRDHPNVSRWLFKLRDDRFDEIEFLKAMEL